MAVEKKEEEVILHRKDIAKVSPEIMQTVYLDEISGRLEDVLNILQDIFNWLESTVTIGALDSFTVNLTTTEPKPVNAHERWYECTIFNDGPGSIRISTISSVYLSNSFLYNAGEQITIPAKKGSKSPVWLQCPTANASVRLVFKS